MKSKIFPIVNVKLDKIVGGGQAIGQMDDGRKIFVWGGLPDETVSVQITKKKSNLAEGIVETVIQASPQRIEPRDADSYLSTSPWQIMDFDSEQGYKCQLIDEAFLMHHVTLPSKTEVFSDNNQFEYRNKVEFSWWYDKDSEKLDLAFFRRGTHGKMPVNGTSLAMPSINQAAIRLRDILRKKDSVKAYDLKTVMIRSSQNGDIAMQLYVKIEDFEILTNQEITDLSVQGFEIIFSNPKSPASVITKRLQSWGTTYLSDTILDTKFNYAVEGFFQINLPVYEQALRDMKQWVIADMPLVDLYSGVGTIGLTIGDKNVTLVEINEAAVDEMRRNIESLDRQEAVKAILAPSENALEYITDEATIVLDPPRAGLHQDVANKILEAMPKRIIYLSCNPVTQARDTEILAQKYKIIYQRGYNFFPKTPHIEHLIVLEAN